MTKNRPTRMKPKSKQSLQQKILEQALNNYPNARKVIYSTCSTLEIENEMVISNFVEAPPKGFKLANLGKMFKGLSTGLDKYEFGKYCIRMEEEKHMTNGFFIAMFERDLGRIEIKEKVEEPDESDSSSSSSESE